MHSGKVVNLLLFAIFCCVALAGDRFDTDQYVHIGEDGIKYSLEKAGNRPEDKMSQDLLQAIEKQRSVDVIVFLHHEQAPAIQEVKDRYRSDIASLSAELRGIHNKYRSTVSLDEEEERYYAQAINDIISAADRKRLEELGESLDRVLDEMRGAVGAEIKTAVAAQQDRFAEEARSHGAEVRQRVALGNAMGLTLPGMALYDLAASDQIARIELDREDDPYETDNSVPSADFDTWWTGGEDGGAYDVGIIDGGVQENHPAFSGVNFYSKPGDTVSGSHGTHVAGIVASADSTYKGGAPGLDAVIWARSSPQSKTMNGMDWMATTPAQRPEAVNHSLGYGTATDTDYSSTDAWYDAFVENYDIMVTKSAGNGNWGSTLTLTHPAPAYNLMAVANMDDKNTSTRTDDVRRSSSSIGPTLNGRKKPDISAPGTNIMSTNSSWSTGSDFVSKSGTSMAAPHVAAAIVLLEDGGNHNPKAQKAVLINTADGWDSKNTSSTADDERVYVSHWDKSYGWGYIDMWESHFNRNDYFTGSVIGRNGTSTDDDYKLYRGRMYTNEKATLVWERRADFSGSSSSPTGTAENLTDLNIRLYNDDTNVLVDYDFDGDDNVHQVAANATIDAVIKVYAWSTTIDGATSESYALATEENFALSSPPLFSLTPIVPKNLKAGDQAQLKLRVINHGDVTAHNIEMNLDFDATRGLVSPAKGETRQKNAVNKISDGEILEYTVDINLDSNAKAGEITIPFRLESRCYGETYTLDKTITLNIQ